MFHDLEIELPVLVVCDACGREQSCESPAQALLEGWLALEPDPLLSTEQWSGTCPRCRLPEPAPDDDH
jgi:hypothetical protein